MEPYGEKECNLFDGSILKYSFMKHAAELDRSDGGKTLLGFVVFIDHASPIGDNLSIKWKIATSCAYGYW